MSRKNLNPSEERVRARGQWLGSGLGRWDVVVVISSCGGVSSSKEGGRGGRGRHSGRV
jgi:hypothetical protein